MKTKEEIEELASKKFTIKQFIGEDDYNRNETIAARCGYVDGYTQCQQDMADELIMFARMHVKAALETVVENINPEKGKYIISNKESILSLYNLDNIK